jgi:transcriptional regulator with XRE-family HTH domain
MLTNEFKARMIMLDLTQEAIAREFGVSTRTVSRWLNETVIPKIAVLGIEALEHRDKAKHC